MEAISGGWPPEDLAIFPKNRLPVLPQLAHSTALDLLENNLDLALHPTFDDSSA